MSVSELFMPIIPRHQKLLTRLIEQFKVDPYGSIGWRGLLEENEAFTIDQLFKPLVDRGLVEDLTEHMGRSGTYFVHITKLGMICQAMGVMLKEPRILTGDEVTKYLAAHLPTSPPPYYRAVPKPQPIEGVK